MHILIIARGIPTPRDAQWGSFEFDQAKALKAMGHKVTMVAVDTRFRYFWRPLGITPRLLDGIQTYNLFYCPSAIIGVLGRKAVDRWMCWQWEQLVRIVQQENEPVDVIYAHYLFNAYYGVRCFSALKAPIVAMEHWSALNQEPMAPQVQQMAQFTYPKLAHLFAVSEPLQKRIQAHFGVTATVLHNMVGDEFGYTPVPAHKPFTFITVGSLLPVKNQALLIDALAALSEQDWQLIIVGEGRERESLQTQITRLGLTDKVHLVGLKNKKEIVELLQHAQVFVLPSLSENFSVAVLEALACGLPVIASITGGIRECIDSQNGLLFEVNDLEGLTNALKHMMHHYADYDRKAISENCKARFSSEVIAKHLTKIFEAVTTHHT